MRKTNGQILGDRQKPALSSNDETFLTDKERAAGLAVSPRALIWPSPESEQVRGAALNVGPEPPRLLPTEQRRKPKATFPERRGSGTLRDRSREVVGDQPKPATSAAEETLLTEQQLANRWQVSPKTLRNARVKGRLISFVKLERLIRYRLSEVIAFEQRNSRRSTSGDEE